MKKFLFIILSLSLFFSIKIFACTTIIVGKKASNDCSIIIARNSDSSASNAVHMVLHPRITNQPGAMFHGLSNDFTYKLPPISYRYSGMPDWNAKDKYWEEFGINENGVSISATETIYSNQATLKIDPYNVKSGIGEESITSLILPRIKTAKEGVQLLGDIITKQGASEGFGAAFADKNEVWYLENAGGHHWLAVRVPDNSYFVSANQSRLQEFNLADKNNYLGSSDLITFSIKNKLYDPTKNEPFNFRKVYGLIWPWNVTYDYMRIWTLQKMFTPKFINDAAAGNFPVFLRPKKLLTVFDVQNGLQNYYQGTENDPYTYQNPKTPYRPISVFRTQVSHVTVVRPDLPEEIANINYIALGMTCLSVYLPFYEGITTVPDAYKIGTDKANAHSAYWKFRKLQTLVMINFPKYAPAVQLAFKNFAKEAAQRQKQLEASYVKIYKNDSTKARKLIQDFTDKMVIDAFNLVDSLINQIITDQTGTTDLTYHYEGA